MEIVSIIKDSFQEYEGQQSLVLFSKGCCWDCVYCYNKEQLVDSPKSMGEAKEVIKQNIDPLTDAVVFLGGEPTIWGESLIEAVRYVKSLGLKTKLFTCGSNPDVVLDLLKEDLLDALSMDFKSPPKTFNEITGSNLLWDDFIAGFKLIVKRTVESGIDFEIRTTVCEGLDVDEVEELKKDLFPNIKHIYTNDFRENLNNAEPDGGGRTGLPFT